jgi:hypothetical protein
MRTKPMDTSDLPCLCGGENGKPCKTGSITAHWDGERDRWIYRCGRGEKGDTFSEGTIWRVLFALRSGSVARHAAAPIIASSAMQARGMEHSAS